MKLVIFGLTISSSWGNGHATLWRALLGALVRRGYRITFLERDVPYYAEHRDLSEIEGVRLVLYSDWEQARSEFKRELADADIGMVTSYCPDGAAASELVVSSAARLKVFYDLDTPVTLERLREGEFVSYIGHRGLSAFDLVLSYTGGKALDGLREQLGARRVAPLYGSVDVNVHHRQPGQEHYRCDMSYMGTYAEDRQRALELFLISPAQMLPHRRFVIGGAMYPQEFPWTGNIFFVRHLPPSEHAAFFSSSRMTLNITRRAMAEMGYCPSGRLFEAAACGTPLLSDWWEGIEQFFTPGSEILIARDTSEAISALEMSDAELSRLASAAFQRTMDEHTADRRAAQMDALLTESPTRMVEA